MNRIDRIFAACKASERAAFIPFVMAGDPSLEATAKILDALPAAEVDIIELGIPFSDPMADGPIIQAAGQRALKAGTTLKDILKLVANFRAKRSIPLVLMGYLNPIYVYGYEAFAEDAAKAGVDGVIIVDLPPEEAAELEPILTRHRISLVRLIAPTSVPDRLAKLASGASGYLYYVSITGVTGAASANAQEVEKSLVAIRRVTDLPICVGFGIKTPEDVKAMATTGADGVVVGSSIVKLVGESGGDAAKVAAYIKSLAAGCRG